MLLAEFEVWHSRPVTPTRRVSLGHLGLPVEPAPGFGGILLGGVVAAHVDAIDSDLRPDLHRLISQVARGERVVQPRMRHRFQVDQHGLGRTVHRLVGVDEQITFQFEDNGAPFPQVLGAVYAAERVSPAVREVLCQLLHRAVSWTGPIGPSLISHLAGVSAARSHSFAAFGDPVAWALEVMGFVPGTARPPRAEVMRQFRSRLMTVHPDHGGRGAEAAKAIADLGEARKILLS